MNIKALYNLQQRTQEGFHKYTNIQEMNQSPRDEDSLQQYSWKDVADLM